MLNKAITRQYQFYQRAVKKGYYHFTGALIRHSDSLSPTPSLFNSFSPTPRHSHLLRVTLTHPCLYYSNAMFASPLKFMFLSTFKIRKSCTSRAMLQAKQLINRKSLRLNFWRIDSLHFIWDFLYFKGWTSFTCQAKTKKGDLLNEDGNDTFLLTMHWALKVTFTSIMF